MPKQKIKNKNKITTFTLNFEEREITSKFQKVTKQEEKQE
jgi:hypothetical protein